MPCRKLSDKSIAYYTFVYKRISFYKKVGAILKKMTIFSKGNALRPVERLIVGEFFLISALKIDTLSVFK